MKIGHNLKEKHGAGARRNDRLRYAAGIAGICFLAMLTGIMIYSRKTDLQRAGIEQEASEYFDGKNDLTAASSNKLEMQKTESSVKISGKAEAAENSKQNPEHDLYRAGAEDDEEENEETSEESLAVWKETTQDHIGQMEEMPDDPHFQNETISGDSFVSDETASVGKESEILHFVDALGNWYEAVIDLSLPRHPYDLSCLKRTGMDISYEQDPAYSIRKGVDVSYHQGTIDWRRVKAAGYEFAFLRVGYRGYGQEGTINVDSEFATNLQNAQAAGLDVGVYFFSQAVNETEALEEAEFVKQQLSGVNLQLPVVYDPELIRGAVSRTDDVTGEQFTKNTIAFCEAMRQAGYEPMIYSNMIWEGLLFDMSRLTGYPFWYADYEPVPQTPYDFSFWQYSEKGKVDGINGIVDLNVQFVPKQ